MKNMALITILFACSLQTLNAQLADTSLYATRYAKTNRAHAIVLGSWGAVNLLGGTAWALGSTGQTRQFNVMNAAWGGINLGIASLMFIGLKKENAKTYSLYDNIQRQAQLEKVLLFNTGLDVGYVMGGLAMNYYGQLPDAKNGQRLQGFGKSIMVQGGFLFVQDLVFYLLHANNRKKHQGGWQVQINGR
ncbi:MAG: hypothetical protein M0D57_22000 [Sphingobacteriales bacterium JAD_PAG50586_3]|nr:MAG: hypothetical protein M0D57_22000 [Sphingobacteriales bacterium JAD_PAG50586_3]